MLIRPAEPGDEAQWRSLWRDYNIFYDAPGVSEEVTHCTWARIMDKHSAVHCIVADKDGQIRGFINYVIHPRTWSVQDCCYLEDLFVDVTARRQGVAENLCLALKEICLQKKLSRIYWNTKENNQVARQLYERIAKKDDFVRYVIQLENPA